MRVTASMLPAKLQDVGGSGTVDAVSQLISLNSPTYLSLMTTTAVLAPLLEETVFRGFLLTSLTKCACCQASRLPSPCAFSEGDMWSYFGGQF